MPSFDRQAPQPRATVIDNRFADVGLNRTSRAKEVGLGQQPSEDVMNDLLGDDDVAHDHRRQRDETPTFHVVGGS